MKTLPLKRVFFTSIIFILLLSVLINGDKFKRQTGILVTLTQIDDGKITVVDTLNEEVEIRAPKIIVPLLLKGNGYYIKYTYSFFLPQSLFTLKMNEERQ